MTNRMFRTALLASTCLVPGYLWADGPLPNDPTIVSGDIAISTPTAGDMLIQQGTHFGVITWGGFSIGAGNSVSFQNGSGATLNRVTGGDLTAIYGSLDATGSVYVINRNGIVIGQDGEVRTGGSFVASTLDLGNGDFRDGGDATFRGDGSGMVLNLGRISSLGGDVAILAQDVVNRGAITAPNGTVGLAAGREILMRDGALAGGMFAVRIGGGDTSVTESGAIAAAAAELRANGGNVYALAGNTEGTIAATGVKKVGGRVFLMAGEGGSVTVDKEVSARNADGSGGKITVDGGWVDMSGRLDASGTQGGEVRITSTVDTDFSGEILAFGDEFTDDGGFVEVSGPHLSFTGRADTGGGTVLIDPDNIEISDNNGELLTGASVLTTGAIIGLLGTGDLVISTDGADGEAGTIAITSALRYSSSSNLTLLASGDIVAMASIQNDSASGGDLNLVAGWDGSTGLGGFDPAGFAGDLASQTAFGNASGAGYNYIFQDYTATGSIFVGDGQQFDGIALGSLTGATRAYAADVSLRGSSNADSANGYAQLGFNPSFAADGLTATGGILVRATGDITLQAGDAGNGAAQIGHGGPNSQVLTFGSTMSVDAPITVEGQGDLAVIAGASSGGSAYAMIGNGTRGFSSFFPSGTRAGDITVTMGGEVSLDQGSTGVDAWIGHGSPSFLATSGDVTLTAAAFDTDAAASVSGGTGEIDVRMLAEDLIGGDVTVVATGSSLRLFGDTVLIDCECNSIDSGFDLVVQASDDIELEKTFLFDNRGTGNVALAAGADFRNFSGRNAFGNFGGGRWLVYSTRPDQNGGDIGVLDADFLRYGVDYDAASPFAAPLSGNGLLYSVTPLITVADATMTYGGALVLPTVAMTVDGVEVDSAAFGYTLADTYVCDCVPVNSFGRIDAGVYDQAFGYNYSRPRGINNINSSGIDRDYGQLTVDRALLGAEIIGAPIKTYDGTTRATLTSADFALFGFMDGEGATVTETRGTYSTANAGPEVGVDANLGKADFLADAGTDLSNYILPTSANGTGAIDRAILTATIVGLPTKIYDGTTTATLTAANFLLEGFATGEGASVNQTVGTYSTPEADVPNTVSAELGDGALSANAGTNFNNYVLPTRALGEGLITRQTQPQPQPFIPLSTPIETFAVTPLGEPSGPAGGLEVIDPETTQRIMDEIRAGAAFCKALVREEYVIDCLSDRLQSVADGLSTVGEYSEVRSALEDAAQRLHALVLANASQELAQQVMRAGGQRSSRPLTAVDTAALGAANAEAGQILEETGLVLLRSSSGSAERREAFTEVAQVVNSTKVLLRSS